MENNQEIKHCLVFYLESELVPNTDPPEIKMFTKQKTIPIELKEKFLSKFKDLKSIKGEEIDQFLKENKI